MGHVFLASMSLTCDSRSTDVLRQFDERWTRALERSWEALAFVANRGLEEQLNGTIMLSCAHALGEDLDCLVMQVAAFEPGRWALQPDGTYFQSCPIRVCDPSSPQAQTWELYAANGKPTPIHVCATFRLVSVPHAKSASVASEGAR